MNIQGYKTALLSLMNSIIIKLPQAINIADTKLNTLNHPVTLNYFLDDWAKWKVDFEGKMK